MIKFDTLLRRLQQSSAFVSLKDTFLGATTGAAGGAGLVPAPPAGAADRVLSADGTWKPAPVSADEFKVGDVLTTRRVPPVPKWRPLDGAVYLKSSYPQLYDVVGNPLMPSVSYTEAGTIGNTLVSRVVRNTSGTLFASLILSDSRQIVRTSTDNGGSWTTRTVRAGSVAGAYSADIISVGGVTTVVCDAGSSGDTNIIYTSTVADGSTWTARLSAPTYTRFDQANPQNFGGGGGMITYGNGRYIVVPTIYSNQNNTYIAYWHTTDPVNVAWTLVGSLPAPINGLSPIGIRFVGGYFLLFTYSGVAYSTDGLTWSFKTNAQIGITTYATGAFFARGRIQLIPNQSVNSNTFVNMVSTTDFNTFATSFRFNGQFSDYNESGDRVLLFCNFSTNNFLFVYEGANNISTYALTSYSVGSGGYGWRPNGDAYRDAGGVLYLDNAGVYRSRTYTVGPITEFQLANSPQTLANTSALVGYNYIRMLD